jgi:hypothetical protein
MGLQPQRKKEGSRPKRQRRAAMPAKIGRIALDLQRQCRYVLAPPSMVSAATFPEGD